MLIGGLQKISLIDYPDKICAIIFTKGCNFRCGFCHNPELVLVNSQQLIIKEEKIFEFLEKRKKLIDGICMTGGEPTLHKDLPEFFKKIKKMGFLIKLDTNGTNPEMLKKLIKEKLVDYIAMDIKAPFRLNFQFPISNFQINSKSQFSKYEKVAGKKVDLNKIKKSIEIIKNSGIDYEFRTTVVPNLVKEEDIISIAKQIKGAKKYFLQQFVPSEKIIDKKYKKIKPYLKEVLEKMRNKAKKYVKKVEVR